MAISAMTTRILPQAKGSGLARPKRSAAPTSRQRGATASRSWAGEAAERPCVTGSPPTELDAWIEERVRKIDEQVHGDDPRADEERDPLHDRPVLGVHRVQQQCADTG